MSAVLILGCDTKAPIEPARAPSESLLAKGGRGGGGTEFATRTALPALSRGVHGEAYAVTQTGSLIAGYSWDQSGLMHPVTWTLQNGAWTITALPYPASATSAIARAVNDQGNVAGNDFPASTPHPLLWSSAGTFTVLGCGELGDVYGMSSGGQILVGVGRQDVPQVAAVWQPGSCRVSLPPLVAGGSARATSVNGDGTIIGGSAGVPVRWRRVSGAWQIEQLDSRPGVVEGANSAGDLAGFVQVPCGSQSCNLGMVWYAAGTSRELPSLSGGSTSPRGINSSGEVVGLSTGGGTGVPFFWSEILGMRQLPVSNGGSAVAVSGVRADGTRLVVGAGGKPFGAQVWVVRNP